MNKLPITLSIPNYKTTVKNLLLLICLVNLSSLQVNAKYNEADHVDYYCNGDIEFVLPDKTRVDCLTEAYACEYDWAKGNKVYECIGQALWYAQNTGKRPCCVLISKDAKPNEYTRRAQEIINYNHLYIDLRLVKNLNE